MTPPSLPGEPVVPETLDVARDGEPVEPLVAEGRRRTSPARSGVNWRLGGLSYLNTRPLVYGIEDLVIPGEPARMADLMRRGQFDAAIVPVAEVLLHDEYDIVDGMAIGTRGDVQSVLLAHRAPVAALRRVAVTPASRTSAWLVRVILKYGYGLAPEFYPKPPGATLSEHEAMLLIGDEAIWYAIREDRQSVLDLGRAWLGLTGLPFVFAVWAVRRGRGHPALVQLLRQAKVNGLAHLEEIVQDSTEATPEYRREYLTRHVCYDLGDKDKQGLRRFQQYLREMDLIPQCHDLRYISG